MLTVVSSPALPTQILVDGQIADSWRLTSLELPPGAHTLSFTHVPGYTEPAPQTTTLNSGATTMVTATFVQRGTLQVTTAPPVASQISIDNNPADDFAVTTDLPPGPHVVCFGIVAGFDAPACQTATVTAGSTTPVVGAFVPHPGNVGPIGVGMLRVTTSPPLPSQISITPAGGSPYIADSWGLNWLQLLQGSYTVSFSHIEGYTEPSPQAVTVTAGLTTTLAGTFTQRGHLRANTAPGVAAAILVDGVPRDDWGMWTDIPTGSHTVCFGAVLGYTNPLSCQTAMVTAGQLTVVSAGYGHSLAVTSTGSVLAWGNNGVGQLGNGSTTDSTLPVPVSLPTGTTVTAVAGGGWHSLARTSTGSLLAWGWNGNGVLGNGTTTSSSLPVSVSLPVGTTITAVAAGYGHSLALTSTGTLLAWGSNGHGQLGNGTTTDSSTPVAVTLPVGTTITKVAAGATHSLAVTSTGAVLAWGWNGLGQLGNGTTTDSPLPTPVGLALGTTISGVAAGYGHSLAVTSAGGVLAWGYNGYGQLGNGTTTDSSVPVSVSLPPGVSTISAGAYHSFALTSTHNALAWGHNGYGQLGNGSTTNSSTPVLASTPPGIIVLVAGSYHSLVVTSTNSGLGWGANESGEMGNGTTINSALPAPVSLPAGTTITAVAAG
jgi:alpha-tubulin suppressor-like RCC1 family protein